MRPSRSAGRGDDDPLDAGDPGRDDGHDQRDWVRRRAARARRRRRWPAASSGARSRCPGAIGRAGRGRALGLGEASDVLDRLVERRARIRGSRRVAGGARGRRGSRTRRPSGRPPPTRAFASRTAASPRSRTSASVAARASRTAGSGTAPRRTSASRSRDRRPGRRRRRPRGRGVAVAARPERGPRVTGRSSRSGGRGCPTRPRP